MELLRKPVSGVMLTLLLIGMLALSFNIQPVKAGGTVYIKANGSVDPPDAPISSVDNITYTLTGNISSDADGIVVEKSNIIIDGNGYALQGDGTGSGFSLSSINNVTIKNTNIKDFDYGVYLESVSNNTISGNNITANNWCGIDLCGSSYNTVSGNNITKSYWGIGFGISLIGSYNNTIYGNNITNNEYGIWLCSYYKNKFYHNNFIDNTQQVHIEVSGVANFWDDGYPSGGNYWSDYSGFDADCDGIGDTSYIIDANNTDRYPLMASINIFDVGTWNGAGYNVDVISNSTVSAFHFNPDEGAFLRFNVSGGSETIGFCRVTIPKNLLWVEDGWTVYVGEESVNYTIIPDNDYTYLYFTYNHSIKAVVIQGTHVIPEFPSTMILLVLMLTTLIAITLLKKKRKTKPNFTKFFRGLFRY